DFGADDIVMTVATDSALLYASERQSFLARRYRDGFDEVNAGKIFSRHLEGIVDDHVLELTHFDRKRIFNLGYYTWVEQQGVAVGDFDRRRDQRFWRGLVGSIPTWDRLIEDLNAEVGAPRASRIGMAANDRKATAKTAPTYLELREELLRRDRSLRDKVVSLEEATSFVRDGDSVGIGGSTMSRTPMGMIWALIRAGRKGLTCSRSIVSSDG